MTQPYAFRWEMELHRKGCCTGKCAPLEGQMRISGRYEIVMPKTDSRVLSYAARDLCRFFADCANLYLRVRYTTNLEKELMHPQNKILLSEQPLAAYPVQSDRAGAYYLQVAQNHIIISGKTDRGCAQGVYYLEDQMKLVGAPILALEGTEHAPLFSPRMTHSGYELDIFPDSFLEAAAHAGMDAILVYAGHPDSHLHGFSDPDALWPDSKMGLCDYATLCYRAAGYGLDVYVYSHMKCDMHPSEEGARAYYEASFGELMRKAPEIAGFILVGETFEFPSKDPHTCGVRFQKKAPDETKPSPGWYPCADYPDLLRLIGEVVHAVNPKTELVFWSYNWGWVDKQARQAIIRALPRGTTLLVTFDMWETYRNELGRTTRIDDYSISICGPSSVFCDEADQAKKCGVKLYAMTNTGGRTWDCGIAPYIPVPGQWIDRYAAMRRCVTEYGLCGVMENHHYGWMPSFLTLLAKNAFDSAGLDDKQMLHRIAGRDYKAGAPLALQAWACFDRGIRRIVACETDQYGPLRAGPSYPLLFDQTAEEIHFPAPRYAWHPGGGIWFYPYPDTVLDDPQISIFRLNRMQEVLQEFRQGNELLRNAAATLRGERRQEAVRQAAVSGILECTFQTALHVMRWNIALRLFRALPSLPACAQQLASALGLSVPLSWQVLGEYMIAVAQAETKNVRAALACYRANSLVGYEASMEYAFNDACAAYKNKLTQQSVRQLRRAIRLKT